MVRRAGRPVGRGGRREEGMGWWWGWGCQGAVCCLWHARGRTKEGPNSVTMEKTSRFSTGVVGGVLATITAQCHTRLSWFVRCRGLFFVGVVSPQRRGVVRWADVEEHRQCVAFLLLIFQLFRQVRSPTFFLLIYMWTLYFFSFCWLGWNISETRYSYCYGIQIARLCIV